MYDLYVPHLPYSDSLEGLHIGQIKHENEAHGPSVISSGNGAVPLLSCCVPDLKLDTFVVPEEFKGDRIGDV